MFFVPALAPQTFEDHFALSEVRPAPEVLAEDALSRSRTLVNPMEIGGARYFFKQTLVGWFNPGIERFYVAEIPFVHGEGKTPSTALRDWQRAFHAAFQRLIDTRDFELNNEELRQKQIIHAVVDVVRYRNTTNYALHKVGFVRSSGAYPTIIQWMDGSRYHIDYGSHDLDPRIAGLLPGQWIEASVQVSPASHEIVGIPTFRRIKRVEPEIDGRPDAVTLRDLPPSESPWT